LILAFCVYVGLALARVPLKQNADGALLTIIALQKLTVYYWWQDRFGMLTPLLTAWIRGPIDNLQAQLLLRVAGGFAAPLFFCGLAFRRPIDCWRAVLLADGLALAADSPGVIHETFIEASPYGVSLALAGLATLVVRAPPRRLGEGAANLFAMALLLAAYIVNAGLAILALPLAFIFAALFPSPRAHRLAALHAFAAVVGFLTPAIVAPQYHTIFRLRFSPPSVLHYAQVLGSEAGWPLVFAALPAPIAAALWLRHSGRNRRFAVFASVSGALLGAAALNFVLVASSRWLALNLFHIRYLVPLFLLLVSLGGIAAWSGVKSLRVGAVARGAAFAGLSLVLMAIALQRSDLRGADDGSLVSEGDLARAVAERYVAHSLDAIAGAGSDHGYWQVWPAVLMTEQTHYDAGYLGPNVIGVSDRGSVRRAEFLARLATQRRLGIACIDLAPSDCADAAGSQMGAGALRFRELAPTEPLPAGHALGFVEVYPADAAD
jgi:hypothetical protein